MSQDNSNPIAQALRVVLGSLVEKTSQLPPPLAYGGAIVIALVVMLVLGAVIPSNFIWPLVIIVLACLSAFIYIDHDERHVNSEVEERKKELDRLAAMGTGTISIHVYQIGDKSIEVVGAEVKIDLPDPQVEYTKNDGSAIFISIPQKFMGKRYDIIAKHKDFKPKVENQRLLSYDQVVEVYMEPIQQPVTPPDNELTVLPVLSIDVMREPAPDTLTLTYVTEQRDGVLIIEPRMGYLDLLRAGGPIGPIQFDWSPFHIEPPRLDIKIVNNTPSTLFFSEAVFALAQSRPDLSPVLVINGMGHQMGFPLFNLGFGNIESCSIRFALSAQDPDVDWDAALPFECNATQAIVATQPIDLSPWFARQGVNITVVRQADSLAQHVAGNVEWAEAPSEAQVRAALGPYTNGVAHVWGRIALVDADKVTHSVRFKSLVRLTEPMPRAPVPPSIIYDACLEIDRNAYEVSVPISQALRAGEVDRFNIRVSAKAASHHRFTLRLRYNNSQIIESQAIDLHLFMTRAEVDLQYQRDQPSNLAKHPSGRMLPHRTEP